MIYNPEEGMLRICSYGGGVQTFGMLLMIRDGLIQRPHAFVFSDTKAEYDATYAHIEGYAKPLCKEMGIPFYTVQFNEGIIEGYKSKNSIPLPGFRSCTFNYKVRPINYKLKELLGDNWTRGEACVNSYIGISTDEAQRAVSRKDQRPKWSMQTYPFLELDMSRRQIIEYIEKSGYPVPIKSGCYICPYHGFKGFVDLKTNHPEKFKIAVEMEELYFEHRPERNHGFLQDTMIRLKELGEIPSLWSFADQIPNETKECDSGGCFL